MMSVELRRLWLVANLNGQVVVTLTRRIATKTAFRFFVLFEEGALPKTTRQKPFRSKFFDTQSCYRVFMLHNSDYPECHHNDVTSRVIWGTPI